MKLLTAIVAMLLLTSQAYAEPAFTDANIVKALAGEAGGQGEAELEAHAHAIANRGHLGGVYGYKRPTSQSTLERARNAWNRALKEPDPVHGADHWLSDYDLTHCKPSRTAFRFKMRETAYIGQTHFYKEV